MQRHRDKKVQREAIWHSWSSVTGLWVEDSWAARMLESPVTMPQCLNFILQRTGATEVFKARVCLELVYSLGRPLCLQRR